MNFERNSVLFVDDEMNILSAIRRAVVDEPFQAFFANSGKEALKIMEEREIAVLVTDMRMPEMDGLQLLKIVKEEYPATVRMVLSGYTQLSQVLATVNQADVFNFITKPWDPEFSLVIKKAIEYYKLKKMEAGMKATLEQRNKVYKKMMGKMEEKIKDQEYRIHTIAKIGEQLKANMDKACNSFVSRHLLKMMLLYAAENMSDGFDLSNEIAFMADMLRARMERPEVRLSIQQESSSRVKGARFLPVSVLESLLNSEEQIPEIQHAQITLKDTEESKAVLEVALVTSTFMEQWQGWIDYWQNFSSKEPLLRIKMLKQKEKQALQIQFIFSLHSSRT